MNGTLTVPLYIVAEERQVAAISRNYTEIVDVRLQPCRPSKIQGWHA
jgi:hypothetical protein